jgi:hypothetical protein
MIGDQNLVILSWGPSEELVDRTVKRLELKLEKFKEKGIDFGQVERIHIFLMLDSIVNLKDESQ